MGNPDLPPPPHVIAKLCKVASKPDAHGYSASRGIPSLRKAQANYYARRFGVDICPDRYACRRVTPISAAASSIGNRSSATSIKTCSLASSLRLIVTVILSTSVGKMACDICIGEGVDISIDDLHQEVR